MTVETNKTNRALNAAAPGKLEPNSPAASAPVVKKVAEVKRISHLKLGPELLRRKASDEEINEAFTKSFNSRGVKDKEFIKKRIAIYMKIAGQAIAKEKAAKAKAKEAVKVTSAKTAIAKTA